MTDIFKDSMALMRAYRQSTDRYNHKQVRLYRKLIGEEFIEFMLAEDEGDIVKESIDLLVVLVGHLHSRGIDAAEAWAEVHRSNLSKLDAKGKPVFREDGKVVKGPNYQPPDMQSILNLRDKP